MAKLQQTAFMEVVFKENKMLGLRFEDCNPFGLSFRFEHCNLSHASFYNTKLQKTPFHHTQLIDVDFSECDLSAAVFEHCDLSGATFDQTNLAKADFRNALNYRIDPERNNIKKARFSQSGISGLLSKYDIEIDRAS
jgi:uncharacterized protein YjbI with pentapeptide repeats